jgi:predicted nucleic acid-binding Zn ribbon protein
MHLKEKLVTDTVTIKECPICDGTFSPKRSDAIYCSARCRVAASRERQRERTTQQFEAQQLRVEVFIKALKNKDRAAYADIVEHLLDEYGLEPAFDTANRLSTVVGVTF